MSSSEHAAAHFSEPAPFHVTPHEVRVHETLGAVFRRQGESYEAVDNATPVDAIILAEAGFPDEERLIRLEAFGALFDYIFLEGCAPDRAMRRLYALAKAFRPEHVMNMSCRDMAAMFGETPAAVSWRINQLVTKKLEAAGARSTHVRGQKTASAREKLSAAQRGNKNRLGRAACRAA